MYSSLRRWIPLVVLAVGISVSATASAAPYSTPTIEAVDASRTSITLRVTAGATGTPAGFLIEWMTAADYYTYGWSYGYLYTCSNWGVPTWNLDSSAGQASYLLAPGGSQIVEMGDLFDETGQTVDYNVELNRGTEYYFRVRANGDANGEASAWSASIESSTDDDDNCTFTQGYWKNHPEAWPVASLMLGSVNYTAAELLSILNTPAGGNGLLILAHQLIATKLNVANGADPTPVAADIAAADAMIGALIIPPIGAGFLAPATVTALATTLDNYNNGNTTVPHCGETPTQSSSWGRVKSLYR
jgi:hypothetical protein